MAQSAQRRDFLRYALRALRYALCACGQGLFNRPDGNLRIFAVLARAGAAARVVRNLYQRQPRDAEERRFLPAKLHEDGLA